MSTREEEVEPYERETIPPPTIPEERISEVRLKVPAVCVMVDVVTANLRNDPRSEEYIGAGLAISLTTPRLCIVPAPANSMPGKARINPFAPPLIIPPPSFARAKARKKQRKMSLRARAQRAS